MMIDSPEQPDRVPDWEFNLDNSGKDPVDPATSLRLSAIRSAARTIAAQQRAMQALARDLEKGIRDALDAGLTVETIADHADLRYSALKAYAEGTQPLFPKGMLG